MKIIRAVVWGEADQREMARLTGLKLAHVYRCDKAARWSIRKGEAFGIFDLRAFGPEKSNWLAGLKEAVQHGGTLVEVNHDGTFGSTCDNASGAVLLADTQRKILAERIMPGDKAKAMAAARYADKIAKRMPEEKARAIWENVTRYPYVEDAIAAMKGWNRNLAYATFLKRPGVKRGRKPADK